MDKYPGQDFAETNGYTLHHSTPNRSATYTKRIVVNAFDESILHLTVYTDNTAKLEKIIGIVTCSVPNFSLPGNLDWFEKRLVLIISY